MKFKSTYILIAVALALAVFAYFYEIRGGKTREASKAKEKKVFDVKADDISWLEISRPGSEPLRVERVGSAEEKAWKIVKPIEARADDGAVGSFTWQLADLSFTDVAQESATDLAPFGLTTPELIVKFGAGAQKKEWAVAFGKKLEIGTDSYAMASGKRRVFVLSQAARSTFDKQTVDLRDKRVVVFDDAKLSAVEISTPEYKVRLEKSGAAWKVASLKADADEDAMKKVLDDLHALEAKEFLPTIMSQSLGLTTPEMTVTLISGADQRMRQTIFFYTGKEEGVAYAQPEGDPWLYKIPPEIVKSLPRPAGEFVERRVLKFERYDVEQVRIKSPDGKPDIVLTKNDTGDWDFTEPKDLKLKIVGSRVYDFLDSLQNLRAVKIVDSPPPEKTIALKPVVVLYKAKAPGKDKKKALEEIGTLQLGSETDGGRYARGAGAQIFLIDPGLRIPTDPKSLTAEGPSPPAVPNPSKPATPELDEDEE